MTGFKVLKKFSITKLIEYSLVNFDIKRPDVQELLKGNSPTAVVAL